jgi:recombinational DNA repair protein (RecF pathway)
LGYTPELNKCAVTSKCLSAHEQIYFSPPAGGIVRQKTHQIDAPISVEAIKTIRYMNRPWSEFSRLKVAKPVAQEVHCHLKNFAEYIMQREIKSEGL